MAFGSVFRAVANLCTVAHCRIAGAPLLKLEDTPGTAIVKRRPGGAVGAA